jgi:hypothetical protein
MLQHDKSTQLLKPYKSCINTIPMKIMISDIYDVLVRVHFYLLAKSLHHWVS